MVGISSTICAGNIRQKRVVAPSRGFSTQSLDDDLISAAYPYSNCYVPTNTNYDLQFCNDDGSCTIEAVNVTTCWDSSQDYNLFYGKDLSVKPAQCIVNSSQLAFNAQGGFLTEQSFYNCLANVDDPGSAPTFYNGSYHGCTFIETTATLVNLVKIDEISDSAGLQFIMDYSWYDYRFDMPEFWAYAQGSWSGIDLTRVLTNDSIVMWLPEVTFPDATDLNIVTATLTMYAPCQFVYEVVYDVTLVQPLFDFKNYPSDTQNIVIRATVMNYDALQLQMFPVNVGYSQIQDGSYSFSHNAIWTNGNENTCTVYYDEKNSDVWPAYVVISVAVDRDANGVIVRLVIPLTLLILLSTLTFWISYESRVDTTITLLLAISALYIIILQNIPMVGYLTSVDKFVFGMFMLLCAIAAMHQVYATMRNKIDRWPLRPLYLRCIELVGRCCVPPIVLYYFAITVQFSNEDSGAGVIMAALAVSLLIFSREFFSVRATFIQCMLQLVDKVNQPDISAKDLSSAETFALNVWIFKEFSFSKLLISGHLQDVGKFEVDTVDDVSLKNVFSLNSLLGRPAKNNAAQHVVAANSIVTPGDVSIEMTGFKQQNFNQVSESQIGVAVRGSISNPLQDVDVPPAAPFRRTIDMNPDSDDEDHV